MSGAGRPIVVTAGNVKYWPWMLNALTHMSTIASSSSGAPRTLAHGLDDATYQLCKSAALPHVRCVRAFDCCNATSSTLANALPAHQLLEAALVYKLAMARLTLQWCLRGWCVDQSGSGLAAVSATRIDSTAVILLDSDALVRTAACFDEWTAFSDDVVTQVGGGPGCPARAFSKLGFGINTGAMLFRGSAAAELLAGALALRACKAPEPTKEFRSHMVPITCALSQHMLRAAFAGPGGTSHYRYTNHCYEQEVSTRLHATRFLAPRTPLCLHIH